MLERTEYSTSAYLKAISIPEKLQKYNLYYKNIALVLKNKSYIVKYFAASLTAYMWYSEQRMDVTIHQALKFFNCHVHKTPRNKIIKKAIMLYPEQIH